MASEQDPEAAELMLCRFRRLMAEVRGGLTHRNNFEPWEIEILLDLLKYRLTQGRWARALQRYQKAVERQLESGLGPPVTMSQFLALRALRKKAVQGGRAAEERAAEGRAAEEGATSESPDGP